MKKLEIFLQERKIEFYPDHEIKSYTTLSIGGRVGYTAVLRSRSDLEALLFLLDAEVYPFILLGGGSNVAFSDGFSPLAVIVNRTAGMEKVDERLVKLDSGVLNRDFLTWAAANGIGGMDFLAGIPGTVGGAAAVNAGAFGKSISSVLEKADIFSPGCNEIKTVDNDYFKFQYRNSVFKYGSEVILNLYLNYTAAPEPDVREKVKANIRYRKDNHPSYSLATAGCFFKNPVQGEQKLSAGRLIESCGFRGTTHDHLQVSGEHANFIVNRGGASFEELNVLVKKITGAVREAKGVELEREVIYVSPDGKKY